MRKRGGGGGMADLFLSWPPSNVGGAHDHGEGTLQRYPGLHHRPDFDGQLGKLEKIVEKCRGRCEGGEKHRE
eukprot:scaffold4635_cov267-Pinguiococcus_pyrenoidosus.AAC.7